ncbi:MAG: 30S ribosomal protein S12 methylthiotransferase RimO [Sedimentisphaerales bacterium]|nr:30S ribosomal protein S12 methylthiotransferase RimO [Sedimentisphaerales bacterium]
MKRLRHEKKIRVGFVALGCPKNMIDSEVMLARIGEAGFLIGADPDQADIVVINTCGFIEPAKQEALEAIRQAVKQKRRGKVHRVVVAGCLSQRMGKSLFKVTEEIDAVIGLDQRNVIGQILIDLISDSSFTNSPISGPAKENHSDSGRLLINPGHWAYLRISEGCDRHCAFCTIPSIRGRFRSKPIDQTEKEARELADSGVLELNLVAQDTTSYGKDLDNGYSLSDLIGRLEQIETLKWIRLLYLYPTSISDELIEMIVNCQKVLRYIDIPIQHISNDVLKAMHRPDRRETTMALIDRLRSAMPDVVLRTTLIVGYPGETEDDFEGLLDFVRWARFDALGCFSFSPEEGTPAASMQDVVPETIKQQRRKVLMLTQQQIAFEKAQALIGKELTCLVDVVGDDGTGQGRFYGQAPEIDSVCLIRDCSVEAGRFIRVRVIDTADYDLVVEQAGD